MSPAGMSAVPADDTIPVQISDTVVRGTVKPTYPVIQYPHTTASGGDAIAGGFIYRGSKIPALRDKLVFGDITTGRMWYAERAAALAADDGNAATVAEIHEIDAGLRRIVEEAYRARGGRGEALPGTAVVSGRGRVDFRFAVDIDGEVYILTKSDGMIRTVVGARAVPLTTPSPSSAGPAVRAQSERRESGTLEARQSPAVYPRVDRRREAARTTPTALPVTATWRRARSRLASSSRSSRSRAGGRRRI